MARKLYAKIPSDRPPRGTKGMRKFVEDNKEALEIFANNNRNALSQSNRLNRQNVDDPSLQRAWHAMSQRDHTGKALRQFKKARNMSNVKAHRALVGAHEVKFGVDPKSK